MTSDRDRLRRLMGEAAALPPDDPLRQDVEAQVVAAGSGAEEEWLGLVRFDETLRLRLQRVPGAPRLEADLLAIPDRVRRPSRAARIHRGRVLAVAAALALLLLGVVRMDGPRGEDPSALREIALLAMGDHFEESPLVVETDDPRDLERALASEVPFPVVVPDLDAHLSLVGGRRCALGSHPVVYTRWRAGGTRYTLYQFRAEEFGLPDAMASTSVPGETGRCRVVLWAEGGRGYALVGAP